MSLLHLLPRLVLPRDAATRCIQHDAPFNHLLLLCSTNPQSHSHRTFATCLRRALSARRRRPAAKFPARQGSTHSRQACVMILFNTSCVPLQYLLNLRKSKPDAPWPHGVTLSVSDLRGRMGCVCGATGQVEAVLESQPADLGSPAENSRYRSPEKFFKSEPLL